MGNGGTDSLHLMTTAETFSHKDLSGKNIECDIVGQQLVVESELLLVGRLQCQCSFPMDVPDVPGLEGGRQLAERERDLQRIGFIVGRQEEVLSSFRIV